MKKILFCIFSIFTIYSVSAQTDYKYLMGQESPFNGEFLEPRYHNIDSIETVYYIDNRMTGSASSSIYSFEEIPGFFTLRSYTLIKQSPDGLTDTLEHHSEDYHTGKPIISKSIKKYREDGTLIYTAPFNELPVGLETNYSYDTNNRIKEINTKEYYDDGKGTFKPEGIVKYDYENNKIDYGDNIPVYIKYTDSGYVAHIQYTYYQNENIIITSDSVTVEYIFDKQNRLTRINYSYPVEYPDSCIEYKYTENGYEEYYNGIKRRLFSFQEDGYCIEIIGYRPYDKYLDGEDADPGILYINFIDRFAYFKNGQDVSNNPIESTSPKVYRIQGGIIVDSGKTTTANIYSIAGNLVKKVQNKESHSIISLPKGIYIITIGNLSYKVLVR